MSADGLREDLFAQLFDNMLTLWAATDFDGCASWFDRWQRVEAAFDAIAQRVDLVAMNYAVYRSIGPEARFDWPVRDLVDPIEARATFLAEMRRLVMGANGVWRQDDIALARTYFL